LAGISYIPVLPFLSDSEEKLDEMIRSAKDYAIKRISKRA